MAYSFLLHSMMSSPEVFASLEVRVDGHQDRAAPTSSAYVRVLALEWAATSPGLTAHRSVKIVLFVCAAEPGIRSIVDLLQVIATLG